MNHYICANFGIWCKVYQLSGSVSRLQEPAETPFISLVFFFFRLLTTSKTRSCQNDGRSYFLLLLSAGKQNCRGLEEAAWQFFQIKKKSLASSWICGKYETVQEDAFLSRWQDFYRDKRPPEFTISCSFSYELWQQNCPQIKTSVILSNFVPGSFLLRPFASEIVQVSCRHSNCIFHSHIFPGFPGHNRRLPSSVRVWVKASNTLSSECLSCEFLPLRVSTVSRAAETVADGLKDELWLQSARVWLQLTSEKKSTSRTISSSSV